ncbi:hypothetical protein Chor_014852 [Crotalus horridus]
MSAMLLIVGSLAERTFLNTPPNLKSSEKKILSDFGQEQERTVPQALEVVSNTLMSHLPSVAQLQQFVQFKS